MSRFVRSVVGFTLVGILAAGNIASAQPPRERVVPPRELPAQPVPGTVPSQTSVHEGARPVEALRSKSILGARVSIQGGVAVGTVEDIVFTESGCIDYLVVAEEGRYVMVPWEAARFNFPQRTATIEITQERFREVPTFTSERWPNVYEPAYRERIYGYYGLKPGQERRMERRDGRR
jgi:hypothetical protein